jgi:hypothetical protein
MKRKSLANLIDEALKVGRSYKVFIEGKKPFVGTYKGVYDGALEFARGVKRIRKAYINPNEIELIKEVGE